MWLFTDTCAWVPLPPGHVHPLHTGTFPGSQGAAGSGGEPPQQHRGAATTRPGVGWRTHSALVLVGAEQVKSWVTPAQHLSAALQIWTHQDRPLLPTITLEGTAPWHVLPWPCCPSTADPLMTATCGNGPHQMPVCSRRIALICHTCPW